MSSNVISLDDLPDDVIRRIIPKAGAKAAKNLQFVRSFTYSIFHSVDVIEHFYCIVYCKHKLSFCDI